MSWSLINKCHTCKERQLCSDRHFIQGAIIGIHNMPYSLEFGHLGSGTVTMECHNFEAEEQE